MRMSRRGLLIGAIAVVTASVASANYHFVHYAGHGAPYAPIYERFQIENLPAGVVPYFIQEPPATLQFSKGDAFPSLVSQVRAAAEVWNSVGSSTFRFTFGGMATPNITMNAPAVLVSFDDELPPGIEALGGPVTRGDIVTLPNGQTFVPIIQSSVVISVDMRSPSESSTGSGPSWSDRLFLTLVHELGHTAGLQHTWTSSVMSTEITRAMSKSHPLGLDDIAGISMLYPTSDWAAAYGSITGQVTLGNQGVNLASVVALTANGEAISTLTNPDGTYVLSGLSAGAYQVYVHPVPPSLPSELFQPVNLVLPVDSQGAVAPGPAFNTIFQTGTASPGDPVQVTAGQATSGVNFSVTQRDSVGVYDVQTYSFYWNDASAQAWTAKPATFLLGNNAAPYVVATGQGLLAADGVSPAPGLSVSVLGAPAIIGPGAVKAYPNETGYLEFDLSLATETVPGRRHLIFTRNGETEILPSALLLSSATPPSISKLQQNSDGTVTVSGSGLDAGTRILFDGAPAAVLQSQGGAVTVVPPPAMPAANASVIALSPSGLDSSSFAPAAAPPAYSYADNGAPAIQVTPSAVPAGSDAILDLTGTNVDFAVSGLKLGFGTSDVAVRHIWLLSRQHAQVAISVAPTAVQGLTTLTLSAGLQLVEDSLSFHITGPSSLPWATLVSTLSGPLTPGLPYPYPLVFRIEDIPDGLGAANFAVAAVTASGDTPLSILAYFGGQILINLPPNLAPGPLPIRFTCNGTVLAPVVLDVGATDPAIVQASNSATNSVYTETAPAYPGDLISMLVTNLAADIAPVDLNSLSVSVNGVSQTVYSAQPQTSGTNLYTVQFKLDPQTQLQAGSGSLPLIITSGSRVSASFALPVSAPVAPASN